MLILPCLAKYHRGTELWGLKCFPAKGMQNVIIICIQNLSYFRFCFLCLHPLMPCVHFTVHSAISSPNVVRCSHKSILQIFILQNRNNLPYWIEELDLPYKFLLEIVLIFLLKTPEFPFSARWLSLEYQQRMILDIGCVVWLSGF